MCNVFCMYGKSFELTISLKAFYATIHYDDINQNCASLTEMVATAFEVPFLRCQ